MLGIIKGIKEIENIKLDRDNREHDGYLVETSKHNYKILIENDFQCCEEWGYFSTEDDYKEFIGSELIEVRLTDTTLNTKILEENIKHGLEDGDIQFVDFVTTGGVFQLAVYNSHNGYYGHDIIIIKDKIVIFEYNI